MSRSTLNMCTEVSGMERRYEVFRMEKLKTEGDVATRLRHDMDLTHIVTDEQGNTREVPYRKTADQEKTENNRYGYKGTPEQRFARSMSAFRKKMPEKVRKNAVKGAQCIMSFSHELLDDPTFNCMEYFQDCMSFVFKEFGEENVFSWALHMDESTPHVSFFFVPKVNGKLNARELFGNKAKLAEWQDKFHEQVGKKYGLERGVKKTNIKNQELRTFYGKLLALKKEFEIPKKGFFQSWDTYKMKIQELFAPLEKAVVSLEQENVRISAKEKDLSQREEALVREQGRIENKLGNKYAEGIMFERKRWLEREEKNEKLISQLQRDANQWQKITRMNQEEFVTWANSWVQALAVEQKKASQTHEKAPKTHSSGRSR